MLLWILKSNVWFFNSKFWNATKIWWWIDDLNLTKDDVENKYSN
jgi:hypothetical protein